MTGQEMQELIDRVADGFPQKFNTTVAPSAREAVLSAAIPHMEQVSKDLEMHKISLQFLESSIEQVFENALTVTPTRTLGYIDDSAVRQSMAFDCPYLFLC